MRRWQCCLVLAMLLLLPTRTGSKLEEDDDNDRNDDNEENDDDDDGDDADDTSEKMDQVVGRRASPVSTSPTPKSILVTRTLKKRALECYVCAYKSEVPSRACLDPSKYRVHTITCHSVDDKCFTSVISKGANYESVARGCRSGCMGSPEVTCCEVNRCNNQALVMPVVPSPRAMAASKSGKAMQPTVLFFVTILLVLQTVVKVAFV